MEIRGRVVLVTGGAVRVGRALVRSLAGEGARVVVHYHSSADAADELIHEIRGQGGEAVAIQADLARMEEVERLAREAIDAFGGVDVLVNNASVFPEERLEEVSETLWDHTMAVNLKAPFFLMQRLASSLRERNGVVVNLTDLAGLQSWSAYAAHGISKAALAHLTRVAARSLAPEVRVVGIAPGTVLPPESFPDEELEKLARRAPLGRIGDPDDVVEALLYLLRADFVTGEILVVDGGRMLRG